MRIWGWGGKSYIYIEGSIGDKETTRMRRSRQYNYKLKTVEKNEIAIFMFDKNNLYVYIKVYNRVLLKGVNAQICPIECSN